MDRSDELGLVGMNRIVWDELGLVGINRIVWDE
jgi:hypothetical protein